MKSLSLDFSFFCNNTLDGNALANCWKSGEDISYLYWMVSGFGWTIAVAAIALTIALVLGVLVGTLKTLPNRPVLSRFLQGYVEVFRNTPLLVLIFVCYHVLPSVLPFLKSISGFWFASLALGVFTSARIAESVSSGLMSLSKGQRNACLALGLSEWKTYRLVLIPSSIRIILPTLTSDAMNVVKNSAVAFAVSVPELTQFAMQAQEETSRGIEVYLAVTLLYITAAFVINRGMVFIEKRLKTPTAQTNQTL